MKKPEVGDIIEGFQQEHKSMFGCNKYWTRLKVEEVSGNKVTLVWSVFEQQRSFFPLGEDFKFTIDWNESNKGFREIIYAGVAQW